MFCALFKMTYAQLTDVHCLCLNGYNWIHGWQTVISYFPCWQAPFVSACVHVYTCQRKSKRIRRGGLPGMKAQYMTCIVLKEISMDEVEIWTSWSMIDELLNLTFLPNIFSVNKSMGKVIFSTFNTLFFSVENENHNMSHGIAWFCLAGSSGEQQKYFQVWVIPPFLELFVFLFPHSVSCSVISTVAGQVYVTFMSLFKVKTSDVKCQY